MLTLNNVKRVSIAALIISALTACSGEPKKESAAVEAKKSSVPEFWPVLDLAVKKDPKVESQVQEILSSMTLEQKVGQVIQPEIRDFTVEDMRKYGFGSYLNGGGSFPNLDKHATPEDWVGLAEAMYQASIDASEDGSTIPTMWGTDAVHGHNNVIGATIFPHNIGLGAARNPELIKKIAAATSVEVQATGIDWIFAPTVAAARDDRWGRTYESYSEDPDIVRDYSAAIVEGLQGDKETGYFGVDKVISTVKHFLGDGGTEKGDDQGNNISSEEDLFKIHAQGYVGGLTAGSQSVMATFNSWHGKKIHGSKYLLTDVLKDRMGFDGFVVGDWNGHGQIKGCTNENCPQAMNAGLDVYMAPTPTWKPLFYNLVEQVKTGVIPQERLDDAVSRVLRVKIRAGILTKPSPKNRPYAAKKELIGAPAHREVAVQAVRESLVLLKNNDGLLPLNPNQNVLIAGDAADNIGKQSGGWSITWQGTGNKNEDFPGGTSIYGGLKEAIEAAGGTVSLSVEGEYTDKPDVAIVVYGEEPYAEGNGDLDNLEYQRGAKKDLALLQKLQSAGIPVVSVYISGRPMWVNAELNASDAFVAAWLPGSEGQGVAQVLVANADGSVNNDFKGKLSFTWPNTPYQVLNRHDEDYNPLFAYGYGLSYASEHENLGMLNTVVESEGSDNLVDMPLFDRAAKTPWRLSAKVEGQETGMDSSVLEVDGLTVRTIDRRVQEDALSLSWSADSATEFGLYASFPEDFMSYMEAGGALQFDVRAHQTAASNLSVSIEYDCLEGCENAVALSSFISGEEATWQTVQVPLSCFAEQGVNLTKVMAPFVLSSGQAAEIAISDVKLVATTDVTSCN